MSEKQTPLLPENNVPADPAASTEHLTPRGKRKQRKEQRTIKSSETQTITELRPIVRPPQSLRDRPTAERKDID